MKTFKKFVEECKQINEAEYNKEWWDSKSDSFKKRYIEKHPNSIYAQKAGASARKPEKSQLNARTNKPMPLKHGLKQVVKNAEKKKAQAEEGKPIAFDKMSKDQRAKAFIKLLNPKKYWVGQVVNPDSDDLPLEVIVDDDGKVIGFEDEATKEKYGKEPTKADIANNKALEKWLGSKEYNEYFGED